MFSDQFILFGVTYSILMQNSMGIDLTKNKLIQENAYKQDTSYNSHNNSFSVYLRGSIYNFFFIFDMSDRNPDGSVNGFPRAA
jgi:hypothetical protein